MMFRFPDQLSCISWDSPLSRLVCKMSCIFKEIKWIFSWSVEANSLQNAPLDAHFYQINLCIILRKMILKIYSVVPPLSLNVNQIEWTYTSPVL